MASPSITWYPDAQNIGQTSVPASRPTLAVHNNTLWVVYLGPPVESAIDAYQVYYQTASATEGPPTWSAPQNVINGPPNKTSNLVMSLGSQIGLRVVHFDGAAAETLVMWVTWTYQNASYGSIFLLDDDSGIWQQFQLPWAQSRLIADGCAGVVNPGSPAEGLIFFTLTPADGTGKQSVIYNYFDYDGRNDGQAWSGDFVWATQTPSPGYNSMCILDWTSATQMILGYYGDDGTTKKLDLYEHDGGQEQFAFIGVFTNNAGGQQDAAWNGAQCSQNPYKPPNLPDLTYAAFASPPTGPSGQVRIAVHTDQWYYSSQVMNYNTVACPAVAAFKDVVFCVWNSADYSGQILFNWGELNSSSEVKKIDASDTYTRRDA